MYPGHHYSLRDNTSLDAEANWLAVKDPKEKKRIQNRLAQRKYREHTVPARTGHARYLTDTFLGQRVKTRLEKLQSRIHHHERVRLQTADQQSHMLQVGGGVPEAQPVS